MELAQDVRAWWGGREMRRKASEPFVEHKSHLSQIRTGAALVLFDVPLGGGLGGVQMREVGGRGAGQIAGAQTDVQGSSFEVVMKRRHSESPRIPLSVGRHGDKGRAAAYGLLCNQEEQGKLTYFGFFKTELKAVHHLKIPLKAFEE